MKILIASDLHWPAINGVATMSRNLAKHMASRGHDVLVIAPSQTGKAYKEVDGNYVIIRTKSIPFILYQNFRISPTPQLEVKKIIKDFDPDIIQIQMLMWIGQATMKYGNKAGIPIVSTVHAIPENLMDNIKMLAPVAKPINSILRGYGSLFYARSDYITIPTQAAIEMLRANERVSNIPIEPISNGIDLKRFTVGKRNPETYKKFDIPTNVPIITYVGRVDAEKHIQVLLRAFKTVLKTHKTHLLIVGFGTDETNLKELAYELDIMKHCTFTGKVSEDDIVALHHIGDVYCMPSPAELQSIATLEAMASGQPIVAVDAGALKELCQDGRNGYLCEKDNDKQVAEGLSKIISDKALREKMSLESLAIAKTHDIEYTMDRYEQSYTDLIKARTKSAT